MRIIIEGDAEVILRSRADASGQEKAKNEADFDAGAPRSTNGMALDGELVLESGSDLAGAAPGDEHEAKDAGGPPSELLRELGESPASPLQPVSPRGSDEDVSTRHTVVTPVDLPRFRRSL